MATAVLDSLGTETEPQGDDLNDLRLGMKTVAGFLRAGGTAEIEAPGTADDETRSGIEEATRKLLVGYEVNRNILSTNADTRERLTHAASMIEQVLEITQSSREPEDEESEGEATEGRDATEKTEPPPEDGGGASP